MDPARDLVQLLARRIAADEAEIAPDLLEGYLAGERNDPAGGEPVLGGFDAGSGFSVLLAAFDMLRANADMLADFLSLGSAAVGLVLNLRAVRGRLGRTGAAATPSTDATRSLLQTLDSIERKLTLSGLPPEQAAEIGRTTLLTLLERPDDARLLLDTLGATRR